MAQLNFDIMSASKALVDRPVQRTLKKRRLPADLVPEPERMSKKRMRPEQGRNGVRTLPLFSCRHCMKTRRCEGLCRRWMAWIRRKVNDFLPQLVQDAVRTFFSLRLAQLQGFDSSDFTEPEIMEAAAWLEEPEARSMFAWIEQKEDTKRIDNFANLEAASKDKDIVQRLKVALIHWHRQIKEENLRFLNFLKEPCEKLAEATPPEIPAILPELLNYVRMIWSISTHYQKEDRISGLLRKMSNEIIKRCQATIDLSDIFAGKVETSMVKLQQCIDCGREWKRAYQKTVRLLSKNTDRPWTFPEGSIFLQIDAFVQRCCDLLEVCQGLQQFACRFRGQAMPAFGGTKAGDQKWGGPKGEISNSLNEIEEPLREFRYRLPLSLSALKSQLRSTTDVCLTENFLKNLQRLQPPYVDYDILDVRAPKWPDHFGAFKNQMRDLEAESSTDAQKLPTLPIIQGHPQFAGPALAVRGLMLRIQQQMAELDQLCYLEPCREQEGCRDIFNTLHGNMETFVLTTFQDWVQELKSEFAGEAGGQDQDYSHIYQSTLQETISSKFKGGLLECNFDKELLKMFQEEPFSPAQLSTSCCVIGAVFEMRCLRQDLSVPEVVPYAAHELAGHRDKLRVLREHVLRVVRDYNQIMSALLPEERRLFNHLIRTLDRKIGPGLTKFNWTSDGIKEFFECAKVYEWVKQFKRNNTEILGVCKKLSELHMIKIEKKTVHRDDEFRDVQEAILPERRREEVKCEFNKSLCKMTELMLGSYSFFETHPPDIQREWKSYVDKVDKSIKEALRKAVKTSLQDLCKALNGDTKTEPSPLFKIQAVLDEPWLATFPQNHPTVHRVAQQRPTAILRLPDAARM
eukprot:s634_g12.t1